MLPATWYTLGLDFCEISSKMTYTTQNTLSKLMPSTYLRRKIGIYVHNITPRPLSRTRLSPINLPKSVLEHRVITDLKHTIGGSAKVLLLSISPYTRGRVWEKPRYENTCTPKTHPPFCARSKLVYWKIESNFFFDSVKYNTRNAEKKEKWKMKWKKTTRRQTIHHTSPHI